MSLDPFIEDSELTLFKGLSELEVNDLFNPPECGLSNPPALPDNDLPPPRFGVS